MKKQIDLMTHRYFRRITLETSFLKEPRRRRKKTMHLRKVIIMLWLQLIPHLIHGL
jgi:hypothetical protein